MKTKIIIICCLSLLVLGHLVPRLKAYFDYSNFDALFSDNRQRNPTTIEIVSGDKRAVFHKETKSYECLLRILQARHTSSALQNAGLGGVSEGPRLQYGELVIHQFGCTSRIKIYHAITNKNYFWFRVPHADGLGHHLPLFALGSNFVDLVDSVASKEAAEQRMDHRDLK